MAAMLIEKSCKQNRALAVIEGFPDDPMPEVLAEQVVRALNDVDRYRAQSPLVAARIIDDLLSFAGGQIPPRISKLLLDMRDIVSVPQKEGVAESRE